MARGSPAASHSGEVQLWDCSEDVVMRIEKLPWCTVSLNVPFSQAWRSASNVIMIQTSLPNKPETLFFIFVGTLTLRL